MCKHILAVFLLLFFLSNTEELFSRNFYVSNSGSDNNNGTSESTPWKTLNKIGSTNFLRGDTIRFKANEIFESSASIAGAKLWVTSSGSLDSPIVYNSYGWESNN